ncbi:cytochrome b/b6 domain-containing protein [Streptomyces triticiradicis]|uniref:cytochrome b/b6 domain-containing protein n=1 Tax=Streptomyces triticiradicis TaxID=2651189 RepID=UPI001788D5C8|nr:cytochrome b/b6 domain-containing protein [Streptomyces triticiradicis]
MNPRRNNSSLPRMGRSAYGVATAVAVVLIPVFVLVGGNAVQDFLNFGAGVLSLVSLTCSVIWGLVAQDRLLLDTRQRIIAQGVHRVTAVGSIAFLLVHITVKLALDHTVLIAALIPFSLGVTGLGGLIGLGSLAGLLMIFVGITGALRNQFAAPAVVAARWRAMHMLAYPALCAALIHGLFAGRAAKPFFMISYELCLVGVMAALLVRAAPNPVKHKIAAQILALTGGGSARGFREDLEASRAAVMESPQGPGGRSDRRSADDGASPRKESSSTLFGGAQGAADTAGFAAAYRTGTMPTVTAPGTGQFPMPGNAQPTETFPSAGNGGAQGGWPVPAQSVGEAPASAYDPLQDTGYTTPVYGNPPVGGYGTSDVYNTGETNASYRTYNSNDTYDSGPTTDVLPGAFDAPGSGESWNAPSGGFK